MYINVLVLDKILAGRIEHHCKERIYHDQGQLIQGMQNWSGIRKPINMIHCINISKGHINMTTP